MANPLLVATDGYIKRTAKRVLVIAVSGYLAFGGGPIPPEPPVSPNFLTDGYVKKSTLELRLKADDEEVITFIKVFLQCQG